MKNLVNSFKYTFKDRNAVFLMLAMLTFLTGLFGRIGIMAYYFIYIMGNPVLIAGFATAMSAGMLVVNFYAPFLLNRFSKKYVGAAGCILQALCCVFFFPESVNHLGEIFSENLKILCLWRYVFLQCFHPIVKKYLESYNPKTLAVIRFLAHFHLLGSRIQVLRHRREQSGGHDRSFRVPVWRDQPDFHFLLYAKRGDH